METRQVAFVLFARFSMIALYGALEPLRVANRFAGPAFAWRFLSIDGRPVAASNDIPVSVSGSLSDIGAPHLALFCASYEPETALTPTVCAAVRKLARRNVLLGGLDTGTFVLAEAGALDGRRATCHWESLPGFRERYPKVQATHGLFESDGGRLTCAGGAAAIDMMLHYIETLHGTALAVEVADQLVHLRPGPGSMEARLPPQTRYQTREPRVISILRLMEDNLEEPLSSAELAASAGLSQRQMERLFRGEVATTARHLYQRLRLERAERLLEYGMMTVREVAVACGYSSLAQFSRAFRRHRGVPPSRLRSKRVAARHDVAMNALSDAAGAPVALSAK
jgi:AraC family carnitine catabolism transcriptional activator